MSIHSHCSSSFSRATSSKVRLSSANFRSHSFRTLSRKPSDSVLCRSANSSSFCRCSASCFFSFATNSLISFVISWSRSSSIASVWLCFVRTAASSVSFAVSLPFASCSSPCSCLRAVLVIEQFLLVEQLRVVPGALAELIGDRLYLLREPLGPFHLHPQLALLLPQPILRFFQRHVQLPQLFRRPAAAFLQETVFLRQLRVFALHLLQLGLLLAQLTLQLTERVLFQLGPCLAVLPLQPFDLLFERLLLLQYLGMCLLHVGQLLLQTTDLLQDVRHLRLQFRLLTDLALERFLQVLLLPPHGVDFGPQVYALRLEVRLLAVRRFELLGELLPLLVEPSSTWFRSRVVSSSFSSAATIDARIDSCSDRSASDSVFSFMIFKLRTSSESVCFCALLGQLAVAIEHFLQADLVALAIAIVQLLRRIECLRQLDELLLVERLGFAARRKLILRLLQLAPALRQLLFMLFDLLLLQPLDFFPSLQQSLFRLVDFLFQFLPGRLKHCQLFLRLLQLFPSLSDLLVVLFELLLLLQLLDFFLALRQTLLRLVDFLLQCFLGRFNGGQMLLFFLQKLLDRRKPFTGGIRALRGILEPFLQTSSVRLVAFSCCRSFSSSMIVRSKSMNFDSSLFFCSLHVLSVLSSSFTRPATLRTSDSSLPSPSFSSSVCFMFFSRLPSCSFSLRTSASFASSSEWIAILFSAIVIAQDGLLPQLVVELRFEGSYSVLEWAGVAHRCHPVPIRPVLAGERDEILFAATNVAILTHHLQLRAERLHHALQLVDFHPQGRIEMRLCLLLQHTLLPQFAHPPQGFILRLDENRARLRVVLLQLAVAPGQLGVPLPVLLVPIERLLVRLEQFVFADQIELVGAVRGDRAGDGFGFASRHVHVRLEMMAGESYAGSRNETSLAIEEFERRRARGWYAEPAPEELAIEADVVAELFGEVPLFRLTLDSTELLPELLAKLLSVCCETGVLTLLEFARCGEF
uniref:Uncharacterized protein n=1 Tax=Anopheles atroparvus TaxID=41427 RepID=A0A182JDM9_ANOAO